MLIQHLAAIIVCLKFQGVSLALKCQNTDTEPGEEGSARRRGTTNNSLYPSVCAPSEAHREEQRHKEGSVAFTVVVLFQGGFFLYCFEGLFHGTLHRINAAHQQMGAMCTRPVTGQAFVFPACQGLSVLPQHCTGCPAAHQKRLLHNLNFVQWNRVYSIDSLGAYLWLETWQNIFWFCQHSGHNWLISIRC